MTSSLSFANMSLIVTAGPTREWIDPVRFITNASSGKTGFEVATAGLHRFKEVIYIAGQCESAYRKVEHANNISVETTADMAKAVLSSISENSVLIMAAAPADFTPTKTNTTKIKKTDNRDNYTIEFTKTIDILKSVGEQAPDTCIRVGFAAETNNLKEYALKKLSSKNAHFICGNTVFKNETGFGETENTLHLFNHSQNEVIIGPLRKSELAKSLLDELEHQISKIDLL
ncbi:MAG: phosphopantothenoylcysteine decarboxylase [Leptonema sp. (in: Bacteria)]|nr:phosphopantothenoylcysteine decarboxylase [Leptonema sp. (in: bacteria)]